MNEIYIPPRVGITDTCRIIKENNAGILAPRELPIIELTVIEISWTHPIEGKSSRCRTWTAIEKHQDWVCFRFVQRLDHDIVQVPVRAHLVGSAIPV